MVVRLLLSLLLLSSAYALAAQDDWEKTRSIAESQHEIVILLIEKKEFDRVLPAASKIFALPFPADQEHRVVDEAKVLTDALLTKSQTGVAHQILDAAIDCVKKNNSKAELYREKAWVFKKEGKPDQAMESFQKAVELEKESS